MGFAYHSARGVERLFAAEESEEEKQAIQERHYKRHRIKQASGNQRLMALCDRKIDVNTSERDAKEVKMEGADFADC